MLDGRCARSSSELLLVPADRFKELCGPIQVADTDHHLLPRRSGYGRFLGKKAPPKTEVIRIFFLTRLKRNGFSLFKINDESSDEPEDDDETKERH